jgi:hypothetical protein
LSFRGAAVLFSRFADLAPMAALGAMAATRNGRAANNVVRLRRR